MIIGSKMAAELAKKKLGERAYAMRSGRRYFVGITGGSRFGVQIVFPKGEGKSWESALRDAGITPPDPLGQVIEKVYTEKQEGGEA